MLTCSTSFFCCSLCSTTSWIIFCSFLSSKLRALICSLRSCRSSFSFVNSILRFFFSLSLSSKTAKQKEHFRFSFLYNRSLLFDQFECVHRDNHEQARQPWSYKSITEWTSQPIKLSKNITSFVVWHNFGLIQDKTD
jgi:hypothetical protein